MDDTIGGFNIGDDNFDGIVQIDLAHVNFDGDRLAQNGVCAGQGDYIRSHGLTGNNMVEQDGFELFEILRE